MARGQQKIQSQQKRAKEMEKKKKAQSGMDSKTAGQKALTYKCSVCMTQMPDPKTYKQHFENKHPKAALPPVLKEA